MEMRSSEEIEIGRDISPTLTPLTFSLHDSNHNTHCSACFSPLSSPSPSIPIPNPLFYCSAALSPLHHSSAETHLPSSAHSSHLRAALRLLRSHRPSPSPSLRLAGLISNRRILTSHPHNHVSERISLGATAMAEAIAKQRAVPNDDAVLEEATIALCAVITNAVEVHDNEERFSIPPSLGSTTAAPPTHATFSSSLLLIPMNLNFFVLLHIHKWVVVGFVLAVMNLTKRCWVMALDWL